MLKNKHITKTMNISDMQTLVDLVLVGNGGNKVIKVSDDSSGYKHTSLKEALGVTDNDISICKDEMNPYIHSLYDQTKIKGNMGEAYNRYANDVVHPFVVARLMEKLGIHMSKEIYNNVNTNRRDRLKGLSIIDSYGKLCSLAKDRIDTLLGDKESKLVDDFIEDNENNSIKITDVNSRINHEEMADMIMYGDRGIATLNKFGYTINGSKRILRKADYIKVTDKEGKAHIYFNQIILLELMVKFDTNVKNECIKLYYKAGKFLYSGLLGRNGDDSRRYIVKEDSHEHLLFKEIANETGLRMEEPVEGKVNIAGMGMLLFATDARVPSDKNMIRLLELMIRQTLGFVNTSFIFSIFYSENKSVQNILIEGLEMLLTETNEATATQLLVWMGRADLTEPNSPHKMDLSNDLTRDGFHVGYTNNIKYEKVKVFDFKLASEKLTTQDLMEG